MKESDLIIITGVAICFLPSLFSYLSKRSEHPNTVYFSGLLLTTASIFLIWTL